MGNRIAATIEEAFPEDPRKQLGTFGSVDEGGTPRRLAEWIQKERVKRKAAVNASGAKAE